MSIRDAIVNATRQTLSSYLAPELVEQLTDEIVHRTAPELEAALVQLSGFELGRAAPPTRVRGATTATKKPKGRPARAEQAGAVDAAVPPAARAASQQANGNEASASH